MKALPPSVNFYKKTPEFANDSIPAGLRRAHRTKAGTWGKIVVSQGELLYRILEPDISELVLTPDRFGVVEPHIWHEVQQIGDVRFHVEFLR